MSSITLDIMTVDQLLAFRTKVDAALALKAGAAAPVPVKKAKRAGGPTAWSDWTKKISTENAEAIQAFKVSSGQKLGAHLTWISQNKGKTNPEWLAFKASWDAANPKSEKSVASSPPSSPASAAPCAPEPAAAPVLKKRGPKKLADMTPEELAAHNERKAARQAKKAAEPAAPVAAAWARAGAAAAPKAEPKPVVADPETKAEQLMWLSALADCHGVVGSPAPKPAAPVADALPELLAFKYDGTNFFRLGVKASDGSVAWETGDLWRITAGEMGAYAGMLQEDGTINADAEEPLLE
jgi:hypothetical protein